MTDDPTSGDSIVEDDPEYRAKVRRRIREGLTADKLAPLVRPATTNQEPLVRLYTKTFGENR